MQALKEAWQRSSASAIAIACSAILASNATSDADLAQLDKIVDSALEAHKQPTGLLLVQADLRNKQKRYAESDQLYKKVLEQLPENIIALNNLAISLAYRKERLDEALTLIRTAIDVAGPISTLLDSRATIYLAHNEPDKAIDDLQDAIADKATPVRYFHLAQAYHQRKRLDDAAEAWTEAHNLGLSAEQLGLTERKAYNELKAELQAAKVGSAPTLPTRR
jgi:tetratricopeptide (TPR) repeat protein